MVDYSKFAKTFSNSRRNMKWEEIEYFLNFLRWKKDLKILDIWCWNWRLLWELIKNEINISDYLWIDLSNWLLDEAKKSFLWYDFLELNMLNLEKINKKFDSIFLIASFHHLKNIQERLKVLKMINGLLEINWKVYITNWALESKLNLEKYKSSKIELSENEFKNFDYNIKIWDSSRYYHCFSLEELEYLFTNTWFNILENFLYENEKNFVSIIEKK